MAGRNSALGEFLEEPSTTDDLDEDNLSLALESLEERLQETERLFGAVRSSQRLAVGLETLAMAAALVPKEHDVEGELLLGAANAVVTQGTDYRFEEIAPGALEDPVFQISEEGAVGNMIKAIFRGIWQTIVRIWEVIAGFFKSASEACFGLDKKLARLRKKVRLNAHRVIANPTFTMGSEASRVGSNYLTPRNAIELNNLTKRASTALDAFFGRYSKDLSTVGENIAKALQSFKVEQPEESLDAVTQAAAALHSSEISKICSQAVQDPRFNVGPGKLWASAPLFCNKTLFYSVPESENDTAVARAYVQRRVRVVFEPTLPSPPVRNRPPEFNTLDPEAALGVLDALEPLIKQVMDYTESQALRNIRQAKDNVLRVSKRLSDDLDRRPNVANNAVVCYRSALEYGVTFSSWATEPHTRLAAASTSYCRAVMALVNRSLGNLR